MSAAGAPPPGSAGARPLRVGLTGGIASGKSTVAALLAARGAAVIDADALARAVTEEPEVVRLIARALGPELVPDGSLDRAAVAARVFVDAGARRALEGIVHPRVRSAAAAREAELASTRDVQVVVHDVPLLFETGLDATMDATVVVTAPLAARMARAALRGGAAADLLRRDEAQLPLEQKESRATFVIDNTGSPEALRQQVDDLWQALLERWSRRGPVSERGSP